MESFYKYYKGEKVAPVLTIVIGGNHEASNHMLELFHGGWYGTQRVLAVHGFCLVTTQLCTLGGILGLPQTSTTWGRQGS